jgi:putative membrane protein
MDPDPNSDSGSGGASGRDPGRADYRFLLANERTFLSYVRTALALQVAGLGVLQFLTHGHSAIRYVLGVALVAAGSYTGFAGHRRMRRNERAIRSGRDIGPSTAGLVVVTIVVAVPLVAAVALTLT